MFVENEYRVFGLRRGGNHAIISWIISAMEDDSVYFFNDILHDYDKLYKSVITSYLDEKIEKLSHKIKKNPTWSEDKKCIIQSYEDQPLSIINEVEKQYNGVVKNKINIIIVRDIYNLIASRLELCRAGSSFTEVTNDVCELWLEYVNEYLNPSNNTVCINYNKWNENEEYRNMIADKLGIKNPDISAKMSFGNMAKLGGTSFSNSQNESCTYNTRWLKYKDDPEFNNIIGKKYVGICKHVFNIA
jgi:hypothetical protein